MANVLPSNGAISFTEIDTLSSGSGTLPPHGLHLSEYAGQDFDIPKTNQPLKFSNFYGAVNYDVTDTISLTALSLTSGPNLTVAYKDISQNVVVNPYPVICLSALNINTVLRTKKTTDNNSSTYVMIDTKVQSLLYGYLDHNVTVWLQKNNETVQQTLKTVISAINITVTVGNGNYQSLINALDLSTVAPAYISAALALNSVSNFTITNFSQNTVNQLIGLANSQSIDTQYSVSSFSPQVIRINQIIYQVVNIPLVTAIADVYDPSGGAHWRANTGPGAGTSLPTIVTLSDLGVQIGDTLTLYIGAGPRTAGAGYLWYSFDLILNVMNNLKLHFS